MIFVQEFNDYFKKGISNPDSAERYFIKLIFSINLEKLEIIDRKMSLF